MAYCTRSIVVSIVDENKVKEAVSVIKEAATTGMTSGGIVVVSSVDGFDDDLNMIGRGIDIKQ